MAFSCIGLSKILPHIDLKPDSTVSFEHFNDPTNTLFRLDVHIRAFRQESLQLFGLQNFQHLKNRPASGLRHRGPDFESGGNRTGEFATHGTRVACRSM